MFNFIFGSFLTLGTIHNVKSRQRRGFTTKTRHRYMVRKGK